MPQGTNPELGSFSDDELRKELRLRKANRKWNADAPKRAEAYRLRTAGKTGPGFGEEVPDSSP
jgi:hypothetical protein